MSVLVGCATPEQLISQNKIHVGMSKGALNDVMLWNTSSLDDIRMGGCTRDYFPDTKHELFSSASRKVFYLFGEVTVRSSANCDDLTGNGVLIAAYDSADGALQVVNNISNKSNNNENNLDINFCNGEYSENTWTNNCFGKIEAEDSQYEGYFHNGLPDGQGILIISDYKIIGTFNDGDIARGRIEPLNGAYYYEGELEGNIPNGQGTYVFEDNSKYSGEFKDGKFNGYGKRTSPDGGVIEGIFKDDDYVGPLNNSSKSIEYANTDDGQLMEVGSGSGFVISNNGHIITNNHVIDGCTEVEIRKDGGMLSTKVIAFDPTNDLAILKAEFTPEKVLLISHENPKLLEDIYVAGFPFGDNVSSTLKVTSGIVSSLTGLGNNFSNMQIDAALQPGNSGGPIINNKGLVIGVAVAKLDALAILEASGSIPENTNFGIKSNVVMSFLESNRINTPNLKSKVLSNSDLGELLTETTYFLSCKMTANQYGLMKSKKVMFKSL